MCTRLAPDALLAEETEVTGPDEEHAPLVRRPEVGAGEAHATLSASGSTARGSHWSLSASSAVRNRSIRLDVLRS